MVKGISRQVIVVHSPDPKLFEQAIFILKDNAQGVTDDALMKEARRLIGASSQGRGAKMLTAGPLWAVGGALLTGLIWIITMVF